MTAHDLLAELHRRGAVAYRVGDRLRVRPADAVPPELLDRLRQYKAALLPLVPERPPDAFLVSSRVLGESVWLTADDATAERLARELAVEGDSRLVFTAVELLPLAEMLEADRRVLLAVLVRIKRAIPGAILEAVTDRDGVGEPS